jgi:phosphoribosyl-ATP pyrophosphohydrolase/phosphoribosyl-AMP cyclohydrolase
MITIDPQQLDFAKLDGLVPAVVQHADTGAVLMLGFMNAEALARTQASGQVTFWSRTKQRLWTKGESSGHHLELVDLHCDCDCDTILVRARPKGPVCHLGTATCFANAAPPPLVFLAELDALIATRARERPEGSYTTRLVEAGVRRVAQKVGEEGVETALAAVAEDDEALLGEAADLVYHLLVLLRVRGLGLPELLAVLAQRHAPAAK